MPVVGIDHVQLAMPHLGIDPSFRAATKAHPGLLVCGLQGIIERSRELGLEVSEAPPFDGCVRAFVIDPFGNRVELMERR